ncbi:RipA family octameric membrane protein [Pantoea dispersa]
MTNLRFWIDVIIPPEKSNLEANFLSRNREYLSALLGPQVKRQYTLSEQDLKRLKEAYDKAHDIRKFEIELFWKRATYFWTITAALVTFLGIIFSSYFNTKNAETSVNVLYVSVFVSILGFLLTIVMSLISKSGRYWQRNWEEHINRLEFLFSGNIHKFHIPSKKPQSISRLNEVAYTLILCLWGLAICISIIKIVDGNGFWYFTSLGLVILLCVIFFSYLKAKTKAIK